MSDIVGRPNVLRGDDELRDRWLRHFCGRWVHAGNALFYISGVAAAQRNPRPFHKDSHHGRVENTSD